MDHQPTLRIPVVLTRQLRKCSPKKDACTQCCVLARFVLTRSTLTQIKHLILMLHHKKVILEYRWSSLENPPMPTFSKVGKLLDVKKRRSQHCMIQSTHLMTNPHRNYLHLPPLGKMTWKKSTIWNTVVNHCHLRLNQNL